jgi:murein L,D-transpeptidase YcbB/YkuD
VKYGKHLPLCLALSVLLEVGCKESVADRDAGTSEQVRQIVASGRLSEIRSPDFRDVQLSVAQVYEQNGFKLLWLVDGQLTNKGQKVLETLRQSSAKGLNPEDYDVFQLSEQLFERGKYNVARYRDQGVFDAAITINLMRYASALHQGRIDPCQAHFAMHPKDLLDPGAFVREYLLSDRGLAEQLAEIEPPFHGYRSTLGALVQYQQMAAQREPPIPKRPPHPLKRGEPLL